MSEPIFDENIGSMSELAERTGGHAAYLTNDLNRAIRRAIDDSACDLYDRLLLN